MRAQKSLPLLLTLVGRMAAFLETVAGSSVRQELEKGPLKGLKASGGQQGKTGEGAVEVGSGERK